MSIASEIKDSFKKGNTLTKLIYINIGVFLLMKILYMFYFLLGMEGRQGFLVLHWLAVPADPELLITRPWTIITYMFLHYDFLHILFNILWLFWFGKIFLEYFTQKHLLSVYILGGLAGAALYIISFNVFPAFQGIVNNSMALGASAAVMAIVIAISVYVPNYTIPLIFIGPVKIKYIAIVGFFSSSIIDFSVNTGGKIAHIGGAFLGILFALQYRKGRDISKGFNRFMDHLFAFFKPGRKMKVTYKKPADDLEYNKQKVERQQQIDEILDKISKSGYESLTKEEKDILFHMSNKN